MDDNACMVWGLTHFIDARKLSIKIAGTASSRSELLHALRTHRPDVVLLEIQLEEKHKGAELVRIVKDNGTARVVVFTASRDAEAHEKAVLAGAEGLILKSEPVEVIVRAIEAVHAGELWLKRDFTARIVAQMVAAYREPGEPACSSEFTPSENRVIAAAVKYRGAPNKVIADALHMSPNTFRNHLSCIYMKLNIHRRLDLVLYGIKHGLAESGASEPVVDAKAAVVFKPPAAAGQSLLADAWRTGQQACPAAAKTARELDAAEPTFPPARPPLSGSAPSVNDSPVRLVRASLRPTGAATAPRR